MSSQVRGERVYIDANLLAHYLIQGSGTLFRRTQRLMNDISNGTYVGVLSTFTISEYLAVARDIIAERVGRTPTAQEMDAAERSLMTFLNDMGIELTDSDVLAGQTLVGEPEIFAQMAAVAKSANSMSRRVDAGRMEWDGPGGADCLVAVFASRLNAKKIATNDQGFRGLRLPGLTPLILGDVYR